MSALQVIEKAALSLPGDAQRQLLAFLSGLVEKNASRTQGSDSPTPPPVSPALHPALLPMVGIIPAEAEAEEIHDYRLLKHA
jgi:hypothetical protein